MKLKIYNKTFEDILIINTNKGTLNANIDYSVNCTTVVASFANMTIKIIGNNEDFKEYSFSIIPLEDLTIYSVERQLYFDEIPLEVIDYKTFRNASAATFIRFDNCGYFAGFANPFCTTIVKGKVVLIQFEAALLLKKDELFEFDITFVGEYKIDGEKLYERIPKSPLGSKDTLYITRYHNPSSLYPLYWNEIQAFQNFTHKYLSPSIDKFIYEYYMYFSPVAPQPNSEIDEKEYYKYIDNFSKMNGDIIVFQPLQRQTPPSLFGNQFWEVYKEGSIGERIVKYAKNKGLKYGIYMGSAQENMEYCNSPMNIYVDKNLKPNWKKIDKFNNITNENCICCDEFAEWFFSVQKNTILKYEMDFWNWDPGLGNGFFCYSDKHGHIPGKGAYKGFKNTQKILKKIKELERNVYLQAFHGMKEYGLWGMKYFDQHEAYWEQDPGFFATSYPDFSADRITANGMRFQAWWNMNYRFLPAAINHSLTNRMIQNCYNPDEYLRYLFDFQGYEFALMSALACGASITSPIIPYNLESHYLKEYIEFYNKWITWAKENFEFLKQGIAFGSQPDLVKVDAYSRIIKDKGFIFLCNGNPMASTLKFKLDGSIGFAGDKKYNIKQIYPTVEFYFDEKLKTGIFEYGDELNIKCPENTILLFEIVDSSEVELYGVAGHIENKTSDSIYLVTESYEKGTNKKIIVANIDKNITNVYINNQIMNYVKLGSNLIMDIVYGKECTKYLKFESKINGEKISFNSFFSIDEEVIDKLNDFKNFVSDEIINKYKNSNNMQLSWTNPSRLYFIIPFIDAEEVDDINVYLNGIEVNVESITNFAITKDKKTCFIVDITDNINDDTNSLIINVDTNNSCNFLGSYLVFPKLSQTKTVNQGLETKFYIDEYLGSNPVLIKSNSENNGIKILSASIDDFKSYTIVTLKVKVNCDSKVVRKILCSCPIIIDSYCRFTMNTDRELQYNENDNIWEVDFYVGNRRLTIIDDKDIHIRAIDVFGYADDYVIDIDWKEF